MYVYECVVWEYVYIFKYSAAVCMYILYYGVSLLYKLH